MNLPNKLTMMRVIMVPFFMVFAAMSHMGTPQFNVCLDSGYSVCCGALLHFWMATGCKNHLVTDFGKFMDPLADKMLTTAAIIYMVVDGLLPRGAGHHHVPRVCCGRCAHDCGRVRYRHCRKHVGQGQNRAADGHHHRSLCHGARPGGRRWGYQLYHPGAVLGRCCRYRTFRLHLPVAESFLLYAGKMMLPPCNRLSGRL